MENPSINPRAKLIKLSMVLLLHHIFNIIINNIQCCIIKMMACAGFIFFKPTPKPIAILFLGMAEPAICTGSANSVYFSYHGSCTAGRGSAQNFFSSLYTSHISANISGSLYVK